METGVHNFFGESKKNVPLRYENDRIYSYAAF